MGEPGPERIRKITRKSLAADLQALQFSPLKLPENVAADLPNEIRRRKVAFWLAESIGTDQIVGRVGVTWTAPRMIDLRRLLEGDGIISQGNDIPDLAYLKVAPVFRNRGIGRRLIQSVHQEAIRRNRDKIYLTVGTDNPDAQRQYLHLGYKPTGFMLHSSGEDISPDGTYVRYEHDTEVFIKNLQ